MPAHRGEDYICQTCRKHTQRVRQEDGPKPCKHCGGVLIKQDDKLTQRLKRARADYDRINPRSSF